MGVFDFRTKINFLSLALRAVGGADILHHESYFGDACRTTSGK